MTGLLWLVGLTAVGGGAVALLIRWGILRYLVGLALAAFVVNQFLQRQGNEVTIYQAMCDPIDYDFWECESKGGHLHPTGTKQYRIDYDKQVVFRLGDQFMSAYRFDKCAVADRLNWSCRYNDDSGLVELINGKLHEVADDEAGRQLIQLRSIKASGQVDPWWWDFSMWSYLFFRPT